MTFVASRTDIVRQPHAATGAGADMLAQLPPLLPPLALPHKRAPPSAAARQRLAEINQRIKSLSRERGALEK